MKLRYPLFGAAAALSCGLLAAPAASALPLKIGADSVARSQALDAPVQEIRYRGRGGRVVHRGYRRGPSGAAIGAGVALGVLGAAAAASAASGPYYGGYGYGAPVYGGYGYGGCYIARQPVHDAWGNYLGTRRVRVCE